MAIVGSKSNDDTTAAAAFKAWLYENVDFAAASADPDACLMDFATNDDLAHYVSKVCATVIVGGWGRDYRWWGL